MKTKFIPLASILLMAMLPFVACQKKTETTGDVQIAAGGGGAGEEGGEGEPGRAETPEQKEVLDKKFEEYSATTLEACKSSVALRADEKIYTGFDGTSTFASSLWLSAGCDIEIDYPTLADEYGEDRLESLFEKIDELVNIAKLIEAAGAPAVTFSDDAVLEQNAADSEGGDFYYKLALTSKAAGESTVTITIGDKTATSTVAVKEYPAADVTAGQAIYDGGTAIAGMPSCASCHQSDKGVDHSSDRVGVCSDTELSGAITAGAYGNNDDDEEGVCTGYELGITHSWGLDEAQTSQVVAYLRTLPLNKPEAEDGADGADAAE